MSRVSFTSAKHPPDNASTRWSWLKARPSKRGFAAMDPLPVLLALEVAIQVARALTAAAARGLVHRDLKPGNLMVVAGDPADAVVVKVIDFGLVKAVAALTTRADLPHPGFSGTPEFAPPEQFRADGTGPDTRSDIYSLGATLWYLLCGQSPHAGRVVGERLDRALPLGQLADRKVPGPVIALLRSMLAADPSDRPQSARDLLVALQRCHRLVATARRRTLAVLAIAAVFCSAIAATFLFFSDRGLASLAAVIVTAIAFCSAVAVPFLFSSRTIASSLAPPEKSIAVLPFENLGDQQDVYLTQGMQARSSITSRGLPI